MDNSVMVRLLAVFVLECAFVMFVYSSTGVRSFLFYSNMPDLASLIPNKVAVEGECARSVENVSQLAQVVNSIRCDSFDPKAPPSELKIPKYSF